MRELTSYEQETLRRRKLELAAMVAKRMELLAELGAHLGVEDASTMVAAPDTQLERLSQLLQSLEFTDESRAEWAHRLGYFLGEVLNQRFGGTWILNESSTSRYFLRIVVGEFSRTRSLNSVADPFGIAVNVLDEDPSIDLRQLVEDVGKALGE